MQTTAIGQDVSVASSTPEPGLGSLNSKDFFRILISELKQQDPFEPTKTSDMVSQVSQIRSIELSGQLTQTLEQLTRQQRMSGASELIGKYVMASVTGPDGTETAVGGVVTGIHFNPDGAAVVELDTGHFVRAEDVAWVTTLEHLAELETPDDEAEAAAGEETAADAKSEATARRRTEPQDSGRLALDASLHL